MSSEIKDDRRYTKDHEWAKKDDGTVSVGITAYAVEQLGDVTLVNIDVAEGDTVDKGKAFGTIESVKTLADLYAPIGGKVTAINGALEDQPELVNDDCYGEGWLVKITSEESLDELLDHGGYAKLLEDS